MRRWLFNIVAGTSLAVCLVTLCLWAVAKMDQRQFTRREIWREGSVVWERFAGFGWDRYGMQLYLYTHGRPFGVDLDVNGRPTQQPGPQDIADAIAEERAYRDRPASMGIVGWQVRVDLEPLNYINWYYVPFRLVVPFNRLVLLAGLAPLAWWLKRRALPWWHRRGQERRLARQGLCRRCGYDLRAHAPGQRCPECGEVVPRDLERKELT